jgi:hypothetical protein
VEGRVVPVTHAPDTCQQGRGVSQSWSSTHRQIDSGRMDGFLFDDNDNAMRQRMIESGLIEEDEFGVSLTSAGIELCKSLQHRVAADQQAAKIVQQREESEASVG